VRLLCDRLQCAPVTSFYQSPELTALRVVTHETQATLLCGCGDSLRCRRIKHAFSKEG